MSDVRDRTRAAKPSEARPPDPVRTVPHRRIVVLADDLIWATRLDRAVRLAGADPATTASGEAFADALSDSDGAIVDLALRRADPIAAIARASAAGRSVVAVGPHEDLEGRRRALSAGAERVYAYSKLFDDGPRTIGAWLDRIAAVVRP